jgi:hypothetical protein
MPPARVGTGDGDDVPAWSWLTGRRIDAAATDDVAVLEPGVEDRFVERERPPVGGERTSMEAQSVELVLQVLGGRTRVGGDEDVVRVAPRVADLEPPRH